MAEVAAWVPPQAWPTAAPARPAARSWLHAVRSVRPAPCFPVGASDAYATQAFIDDLAGRLANPVQLTNDGHKPYVERVEQSFGADFVDAG